MADLSQRRVAAAVVVAGLLLTVAGCGSGSLEPDGAAEPEETTASQPADDGGADAAADDTDADAAGLDPQCGQDTRTIVHELGETTIEGKPERVVVLEFSFADALASIGVRPVGIADDDDPGRIIEPVAEFIGDYTGVGARQSPSLQNIATLRPDLIIADPSRHSEIHAQLEAIAPTVQLPSNQATFQLNVDASRQVGVALDECAAMEERIAENAEVLADYAALLPGDLPPALFAVGSDASVTVHNAAGYLPSVLIELGLDYALEADPAAPQAEMSEETLVTLNPAILFVASTELAPTIFDTWAEDPVGSTIQAVQDDRFYRVDSNLWSRAKGITASEVIAAEVVELLGA